MTVRPLNLNIMIGDTMNNNPEKRIKYPSPLDKFKNEHLFLNPGGKEDCPVNRGSASNSSTNSSLTTSGPPPALRFLNRFPNTCRQWPDPPPPPTRTKKTIKSVCNRRRPGTADPRFHRHIGNLERQKLNNVTQSEIITKSCPPESSTIQHISESTPTACYRRNAQINHVNEWLQSQVSIVPITADSTTATIDFDKTPIKDVVIVDSKFCQTEKIKKSSRSPRKKNRSRSPSPDIMRHRSIKKSKDKTKSTRSKGSQVDKISPRYRLAKEDGILPSNRLTIDLSDDDEYKETLRLSPNDVVHKYPEDSTIFDYGDESVVSFGSDYTENILKKNIGTGDAAIDRLGSIDIKHSRGFSRRNSGTNFRSHKLVFEHNVNRHMVIPQDDEQNRPSTFYEKALSLNIDAPESIKQFFNKMTWKTVGIWFTWSSIAMVILYIWVWSLSHIGPVLKTLFGEAYGRPEETFVDKYVVGPFIEGPIYLIGKVIEKLFYLLAMPVTR